MPTGNPLSGHTEANTTNTVDGLRDGDHILSPSFTNQYEGIHGNGIILQEDGNAADSDRNAPESLPGAVSRLNATTVQIKGGYCALDGVVYKFANGPGNTLDIEFDDGTPSPFDRTGGTGGGGRQLMSGAGEEVLYTVYVCADDGGGATKNVCYMQGSVITTATDAFADSPDLYLRNPHGAALTNLQSCVLAVVRATSTGGSGPDRIDILEVNDKRHFLNGGPFYMHPMKLESGPSDPVDSAADLDLLHGGANEDGDFNTAACDFGALWLSQNATGDQTLFFSGRNGAGTRFTRPVDTMGDVEVISTSSNQTFTHNGKRIWIITAGAGLTLNPSGGFHEGYTIEVRAITNTVTFDAPGGGSRLNEAVAAGRYARFVYTGSAWVKVCLVASL